MHHRRLVEEKGMKKQRQSILNNIWTPFPPINLSLSWFAFEFSFTQRSIRHYNILYLIKRCKCDESEIGRFIFKKFPLRISEMNCIFSFNQTSFIYSAPEHFLGEKTNVSKVWFERNAFITSPELSSVKIYKVCSTRIIFSYEISFPVT